MGKLIINVFRCAVGRFFLLVLLFIVAVVGCVVIILMGDQIDWVVKKLHGVHEHYNELMEAEELA
jgi:hypothetical protein